MGGAPTTQNGVLTTTAIFHQTAWGRTSHRQGTDLTIGNADPLAVEPVVLKDGATITATARWGGRRWVGGPVVRGRFGGFLLFCHGLGVGAGCFVGARGSLYVSFWSF